MTQAPDIVVVLADDMGYSDIGCYGGEIETPSLDALAGGGLRLSQFYNTARCSPSRASLLTGLHPHQTGIGILTDDDTPDGYAGNLNDRCVTIAEVLGANGYATYLSGKWHMTNDFHTPNDAWPTRRGFQHFYGTINGAGSYFDPRTLHRGEDLAEDDTREPGYYYTDVISDEAARYVSEHHERQPEQPLFLYVAYTAPHWPLHATEVDIAHYRGRFDEGWDSLRAKRSQRLVELGILSEHWPLSDRDPTQPAWEDAENRDWEARRMEVYAAQVQSMDAGIGRVVAALEAAGRLDNTLFLFLADNGGCAEVMRPSMQQALVDTGLGGMMRPRTRDGRLVQFGNRPEVMPGPADTFASYGVAWANLSNTPFREYKHWVHEGGIATPLIVHWPRGLGGEGQVRHHAHQLTDVMPTVLEAAGVEYPEAFRGRDVLPLEGVSMLPTLRGESPPERTLYWEHEGNAAARRGRWKLVRKYPGDWELYDMVTDRTELQDLAAAHPELVAELAGAYEDWARRCGVIPRERILAAYQRRR